MRWAEQMDVNLAARLVVKMDDQLVGWMVLRSAVWKGVHLAESLAVKLGDQLVE